jgi:hypothetical protein
MNNKRQMHGALKQFDASEHAVYDTAGKTAMLVYLNNKLTKYKTIENPNKYGIDLLTLDANNKVQYCWELEVRHGNWKDDTKFPYKEINCIERKDYQWRHDQEFYDKIPFDVSNQCIAYYVQLNKQCNRAVIIRDSVILTFPLKPWANRKAENEYVRQVPINSTTEIDLRQ